MLDIGLEGWTADDIREHLTEEKACVAMAIFPKELYTGTYTSDLFASDATTYFDDTEQFLALQKQAVEQLAEDYKAKGFAHVTILEDEHFRSWKYREAEEGETAGVVIAFRYGNVEIHEGVVSRELDQKTDEATAGNPFAKKKAIAQYPRPLCEYIAMHKSVAVQKALFDDARTAKVVAVVQMLGDGWTDGVSLKTHGCLSYFREDKTPPLAYRGMEELARTFLTALGRKTQKGVSAWEELARQSRYEDDLYTAVKALPEDRLDDLHLFLTVLCFGQGSTSRLDSRADSLFNRVAQDLGVDMRNWWTPDEAFLKRRNKGQLEQLMADSGTKKRFGALLQGKKANLVKQLAKYFKSLQTKKKLTDEEQAVREWLPEVMLFPAIDPDAVQLDAEDECEELEDDDLSSDEEELVEAA